MHVTDTLPDDLPDDAMWVMGCSKDLKANEALALTEPQVSQMAIDAYYEAWAKVGRGSGNGWRARFVHELVQNLEVSLYEHYELPLDD